jgi:cysteine-rich repeat protein
MNRESTAALAWLVAVVGCGDNGLNRAPEVSTSHLEVSTVEDSVVAIDASAIDPEGGNVTYRISTPDHGTITGAGPRFTYTPAPNFSGHETLTITVSDGRNTVEVTVDVTVADVNDAPVAEDQQSTTNEGQGVAIALTVTDVDSATLSYTIDAPPVHGALTGTPPYVTYTPDPHYVGMDSFTFEVSDGSLSSNVATVTISVADVVACGDGVVEDAEQCDDGNDDDTDGCLSSCMLAACGDGFVQAGVEACDDGNQDDTDACHNDCTLPVCGNNVTEPGEECDDGNTADGDGCGHSCKTERCGDGLVQFNLTEECDDGNIANGDGCDSACHVEPFETVAPIKISASLSCTTAVANAARKIAVDGSGTIYAVMKCGTAAAVVVSTDRGHSYSAPLDLSAALPNAPVTISQVAVASGPSGVAYVGLMLNTGAIYLRTTQDQGASWGSAVSVGLATSTSSGLSLQSFNDDVYVGFSMTGGVNVGRNHHRGVGAFDLTPVAMSIAFFDLLFDAVHGTLAVCADTPTFHIRVSDDAGVSFNAEVKPPGSEYYSDWAIGNGKIFVSGTNLGSAGGAANLYIVSTSSVTSSTFVAGLPAVTAARRSSTAAASSSIDSHSARARSARPG